VKNQLDKPIPNVNNLANTSQWTGICSLLPYLLLGIILYLGAKGVDVEEFALIALDILPIYFFIGIVLGLVSLTTGILAIRQIKSGQNIEVGNRSAIVGMLLGILGIIANIVFWYIFILSIITRD
jgi:hypothetical protein